MSPTLVVITPIRNEEWILDRFLAVTSKFADLILILDQNSTDSSREICCRFPKVVLLNNPSTEYDEASRQQRLLAEARERVSGNRFLLALDADELVAADAPASAGWEKMLSAAPGTVVYLEKVDLLAPLDRAVRYEPWPLGYVDDGTIHIPSKIHSIRIPMTPDAPRLVINDAKILHYAFTRPTAYRAKQRLYAVLEAINSTSPLRHRRITYAANRDWTSGHRVEPVVPGWFTGWETVGINMRTVHDVTYSWHDFEVLRLFAIHGVDRFRFDDIWDTDWEACRQVGLKRGEPGMPNFSIPTAGLAARLAGRIVAASTIIARRLKGYR